MQRLYETHKDIAEFRIVYINEAHPADGDWPVEFAKEKGLNEHVTYHDRCTSAEMMLVEEAVTIPCLIDNMDNKVNEAYSAWPDRIFVVRTDGTLAVAGKRGPFGFAPAIKETAEWLAAYQAAAATPTKPQAQESE